MQYSRESRELLRQAATDARSLGHSYVGSSHLLMAFAGERNLAGNLLRGYGISREMTGHMAAILYGTGGRGLPLHQGFTGKMSGILRGAATEARCRKSTLVEPLDIFLAMLRCEACSAGELLRIYGVAPHDLFHRTVDLLQRSQIIRNEKKEAADMRLLEQFSEDLIMKASSMEPVIGREREIDAVIGILSRKNKNNPALIGEPGVGKTAIAEGLAQRMAAGNVPPQLKDKRLVSLNISNLVGI